MFQLRNPRNRASFPDYTIDIKEKQGDRHQSLDPPYKLTFPPAEPANDKEAVTIAVESYPALNRGPYPHSEPKVIYDFFPFLNYEKC
jgi:hypothetical protein